MKNYIFFLLFFFISLPLMAQQSAIVTVQWNKNTESDLAGYMVYYGLESRKYSHSVATTDTVQNIVLTELDTTYYFAVTAFDSVGNESDFSDEVSIFIKSINKPQKPGGLNVNYMIFNISPFQNNFFMKKQ